MVWFVDHYDSKSPDDFILAGNNLTDADRMDLYLNGPDKAEIPHTFYRESVILKNVERKSLEGTMPSALARPPSAIRQAQMATDEWETYAADKGREYVLPPPLPDALHPMEHDMEPIPPPAEFENESLPEADQDPGSRPVVAIDAAAPEVEEKKEGPEQKRQKTVHASAPAQQEEKEMGPRSDTVVKIDPAKVYPDRSVKNMRSIVTHQTLGYVYATYHDHEKGGRRRVLMDYDAIQDADGNRAKYTVKQELKFAVLWFDGCDLGYTEEMEDGIGFDFIAERAVFRNEWIPDPEEYADILEMMGIMSIDTGSSC